MKARAVRGIVFLPDGVSLEWMELDDTRDSGLQLSRQLFVPAVDEYAELIDDLVDAAYKALDLLVTDFETNPPSRAARQVSSGEDVDEVSPWDNPDERVLPELPSTQHQE